MHLTCSLQIISFLCCFCCHISQLKHPKLKLFFWRYKGEEEKNPSKTLEFIFRIQFSPIFATFMKGTTFFLVLCLTTSKWIFCDFDAMHRKICTKLEGNKKIFKWTSIEVGRFVGICSRWELFGLWASFWVRDLVNWKIGIASLQMSWS
jgi:hypothetical protein